MYTIVGTGSWRIKYSFSSQLSIEEFSKRIEERTKPLNRWSIFNGSGIVSKVSGDKIKLADAGNASLINRPLTFSGRVIEKDGVLCLQGGFYPPILARIWPKIMIGLAWTGFIAACISNLALEQFTFVFPIVTVWTILILLMERLPVPFSKKQRQAVLNFIENNLLK
jgi:hypothetical protein